MVNCVAFLQPGGPRRATQPSGAEFNLALPPPMASMAMTAGMGDNGPVMMSNSKLASGEMRRVKTMDVYKLI